jgi:hypothetical protein
VTSAPPANQSDGSGVNYATVTVSEEYRDKLRIAKAEEGLSYEQFLRQHVPLDEE